MPIAIAETPDGTLVEICQTAERAGPGIVATVFRTEPLPPALRLKWDQVDVGKLTKQTVDKIRAGDETELAKVTKAKPAPPEAPVDPAPVG